MLFRPIALAAALTYAASGTGGATFFNFNSPCLNNAGEIAFSGSLAGTGVGLDDNSGIFTSSGLVVRKGDVLDFGGGNRRPGPDAPPRA